jgi:HlyD family type I secretion membrane fusion protein
MSNSKIQNIHQQPAPVIYNPTKTPRVQILHGSLFADNHRHSPIFGTLIAVCCLVIFCFVTWICLAQLEQRLIATGRVLPGLGMQDVNLRESGFVVSRYFVNESDHVAQGQPLVELRRPDLEHRLNELTAQRAALIPVVTRLTAEHENKMPEFWQDGLDQTAVARERAAFTERHDMLQKDLESSQQQVANFGAQVNKLANQIARLENELKSLEGPQEIVVNIDGHPFSPDTFEEKSTARKKKIHEELTPLRKDLNNAQIALRSAQERSAPIISNYRNSVVTELESKKNQLSQIENEMQNLQLGMSDLLIRSKVDGYVRDLVPVGTDTEVEPFQSLMRILPEAEEVLVVVPLTTAQAKDVKTGQMALIEVKLQKLNSSARLQGVVQQLNAWPSDTGTGPKYEAVIMAKGLTAADDQGQQIRLSPGTAVTVNLATSHRTMMQSLLHKAPWLEHLI